MDNFKNQVLRSGCCVHTTKAVNKLSDGVAGDLINREQMAEIIGRGCRTHEPGYGNVCQAIKIVIREHGIVWKWSRADEAWKCLGDDERLIFAQSISKSATKRLRHSTTIAGCVKFESLTDEGRKTHTILVLQNQLAQTSLSKPLTRRLEAMGQVQKLLQPDYDKLAALLKSPNGNAGPDKT